MKDFENDYLKMTILDERKFEVNFLGYIMTYSSSEAYMPRNFEDVKRKRLKAYELIPIGCKAIPRDLSPLLDGLFIGGVMEDSLRVVYGLGTSGRGIGGYSCSVFFLPNDDVIKSITNYSSLHGDFITKT